MFVRFPARLRFVLACASLALAFAASCGKNTPTSPSATTITKTDLRVGSGDEAAAGKSVTVNYSGWLFDKSKTDQKGLLFDTSTGVEPFTFLLGAGHVIPGWDEGLVGMKVGGLRRLIVPPALAYGGARNGPIPANSTLVFEVELLSVQ
jgi:FKBP-type peptidyl-prolyl cis-trans isomerase